MIWYIVIPGSSIIGIIFIVFGYKKIKRGETDFVLKHFLKNLSLPIDKASGPQLIIQGIAFILNSFMLYWIYNYFKNKGPCP